MDFKTIAKGAISLVVRRYSGPFWFRRKQLAKTQWLSKQELDELQLKLLKKLVCHCYDWILYYRQLMDARGIRAEDIKSLEDIKIFPILTKKEVLRAGDRLFSARYPRWLVRTAYTGGTTGTPLMLRRDLFSIGNEHAFVRRQLDWAGIGLRDKCAYLTGRLVAKPDQTGRLYAFDPIMNELILSTYHLSANTARRYAHAMKQYKIKALVGYPSAVYLLARSCLDFGMKLGLSAVITSSETLTESMRYTIAEAFNCRVFDSYGSAERVCYIFTCERGSYHVIPEYGLTELIPVDNSEDGHCRIVSTGFWNLAMPLIRYELNDVVVKSAESCSCGRWFPMVESIVGRQADTISTPSGRKLGAAVLTHLLYGTNHIAESQIIQDALDHITIRYVVDEKFSKEDLDAFSDLIVRHLPSELKFKLEEVEEIERTSSGKLRSVISQITS